MAEPDAEEDIFADLYDDNDAAPAQAEPAGQATAPEPESEPPLKAEHKEPVASEVVQPDVFGQQENVQSEQQPMPQSEGMQGVQGHDGADDYERPIGIKEDGKMFIGGLNWETTDQSLKDYFSQFGEVTECTVMRDGATGRSRGFGFLTFRDPKTVNVVMVKEHALDGKLIDPKRAIPREEQERTAKIFVGGVSQECTESEFKEFFMAFGRVLDATLMMDKDTGRPRGFGFVTFDSDAAVDRTLEGPLAIHNKMIEVKRAQPRGNLRNDDDGPGKFGRGGHQNKGNFGGGNQGGGNFNQQQPNNMAPDGQNGPNNMSPAMMAQYWQRMQQYFSMMQQNMAMQQNPAMMQQMMGRQQGMNPQMMQQMAQMQGGGGGGGQGMGNGGYGGMNNGGGDSNGNGTPNNNSGGGGGGGNNGQRPNFNAQEQMMFEQQKYELQQRARMQQGNFQSGNTWEGMYDDVPAPAHVRGGFNGGGGRGGAGAGRGDGRSPAPAGTPSNAPANAPTGPKNSGFHGGGGGGGGYRGGGRGGRRGFHPYSRGGG